jgi:hypothetical protein
MARQIRDGDEYDAYTSWRRFYPYLQRAGAVKAIKRRTHKRERREGRAEARERREET